jgi:leucine dehydrogenase
LSIFEAEDFADHDQVSFCRDRGAGLFAIIAIHDVTLGPAAGGARMWPYASEAEATRDALRLSRGMTYKNVMADLPHGGGKAVILGDPRTDKSEALLRAFGRFIDALGGRYIAAEDVGMTAGDMDIMASETRHVAGVSNGRGASGDPSPFTAHGVFAALRVAVQHQLQRESLEGLRVAVQGVGSVGMYLCQLLHAQGATLVVSDVNPEAVAEAVARFGARAVRPEDIYAEDVDVFAPCALGAVLNDETLAKLRASLVVGAANNQLARPHHGDELARRGVLYTPDYVVNAGGIINVAAEIAGDYDADVVLERAEKIGERLREILCEAKRKGEAPFRVADAMAREKLEAARAAQSQAAAP